MDTARRSRLGWGVLGAAAAAWFAIWFLFFPQFVPAYFAWDIEPRFAQVFIGAGYVFRTAFFLNAAFERSWLRLRWIVWGNLVFTGILLLATYWHVGEFHWNPFETPLAHIWIVLYIFEPVVMLYLIPPGTLSAPSLTSGGPVLPWFKRFLVLVTGLLLMNGLLLLINPEFAATRWAWELNPLDARMVSAWFLGWSVWCGTMAFARDWDEIRTAARLFILNGVALIAVTVVFRDEFLPGRGTAVGFAVGLAVMTGIMTGFHVLQDRRRPTDQPASLFENARFALTYALPSLLRGAVIPQSFWTELTTRLNTGQWAMATIERLSERHGGRSVLLRSVLGETVLILTTDDVRRVLDSPVEMFSLDAREKQRALEPFAPDALNASPPALHGQRRPFNEAVLDYGHEPHRLAERFLAIVGEEITAMLGTATVLDYERSLAGFRRISRRCVLGESAADDTELSEEHSRLRADGDWLGLKIWNRGRDARLRASMDERIRGYVDAAEPGTLVSLFPSSPQERETLPNGQVPFWLMALDAVRTVVTNALALVATHPAARAKAHEEIAAADLTHGRGTVAGLGDLRFVRACIQESIRLWPAAPTLVRRTNTETEWHGTIVPAGTRVLIPAAVFHRARRLSYANRFAPEIWLDGSGDADWSLNLFSRGRAQCAGRNLALVLSTASLAELLRQAEFGLLRPKLSPGRPLPYAINPLTTRFAVSGRPSK